MAQIQIHDNDLLWKYYQKFHTLIGDPVPKPTNLCPYFWTAILGMLGSFWMEAKLWMVWSVNAVGVGASIYLGYYLKSLGTAPSIWMFLLAMILWISTAASSFATLGFTAERLKGFWKKLYIGTGITAIVGLFLYGLGFVIYDIATRPPSPSLPPVDWPEVFRVIGIMATGAFGLFLVIFAGCVIWELVLNPMRSWRFFQSIWNMIKALKNGICPMITSPPAFLADLEEKERLAKEKIAKEKLAKEKDVEEKKDAEPVPEATG